MVIDKPSMETSVKHGDVPATTHLILNDIEWIGWSFSELRQEPHNVYNQFLKRKNTEKKHLVGGFNPTPLKNMSSSVGVTIPNYWGK